MRTSTGNRTKFYKCIGSIWIFATVSVLVVPKVAHALSCANDYVRFPQEGQQDVPTNTLLWGYFDAPDFRDVRLMGPDGEISLQAGHLELHNNELEVLLPAEELLPNTEYRLDLSYVDAGQTVEEAPVRFVTGSGPTLDRPVRPELLSQESGSGAGWLGSPNRWVRLQFEAQGIVVGASGAQDNLATSVRQMLKLVDAPEAPEVVVSSLWISEGGNMSVGQGDCVTWPGGGGDVAELTFGSFDLAGNFSGWTDPLLSVQLPSVQEAEREVAAATVSTPDTPPNPTTSWESPQGNEAGCTLGAVSPLGGAGVAGAFWSVLLGALGLGLRRRNTRRSCHSTVGGPK